MFLQQLTTQTSFSLLAFHTLNRYESHANVTWFANVVVYHDKQQHYVSNKMSPKTQKLQ